MPVELFHSVLEIGASTITAGAALLMEIEYIEERIPILTDAFRGLYELEHAAKRKLILLVSGYGILLTVAWNVLKEKEKPRTRLKFK